MGNVTAFSNHEEGSITGFEAQIKLHCMCNLNHKHQHSFIYLSFFANTHTYIQVLLAITFLCSKIYRWCSTLYKYDCFFAMPSPHIKAIFNKYVIVSYCEAFLLLFLHAYLNMYFGGRK